jgi:surfactin synthase thioesterase subunit
MALAWSEVLAVPVETIGRSDDFFQRGGSSLSALRLVIALDRQITLANLTSKPALADLAELLVHGDSAPEHHLHRLSPPEEPTHTILVGFPYAGGNALNYRPLADALRGSGIAVYGVERSGDFDTMVERVVAEISELGEQRVLLWGHSAGAAGALATARRLDTVQRVFIGAQLPGTIEQRHAVIAETRAIDDRSLLAELAEEAGVDELRRLSADHADRYRYDSIRASEFFIALHEHGSSFVEVPVTVVLAKDDPSLLDGDWSAFADDVEVRELTEGGHYFLATRTAEVADIVSDRGDRT